ncbi:MAG: glycosyltransferase family 2 protein [ANME-2 cluster archaeon]|nr:glycosyltransferase family 2 protein [ANME-2 cluster archaeon]MBC2747067.1 glycosyltransferase family 2 protein [ANME-2 cluster archaeon]
MTHPKVTIIILNWNGKEDTIECLESLKHITYPNYEILLVDNGSTDGSVECLRGRYPGMEIIENGENLGFAEGNNVGIRKAMDEGADYVLLLNNDTVVDPEFLGELVKVGESSPKTGIVGPKIYFYDSDRIQSCGGRINFYKGVVQGQKKYHRDLNHSKEIINTEFLSGCAMLIKKIVFENVGLFDVSYFAYYEDTDLCVRTKAAGYDLLCVQSSIIWHKGSQSSKENRFGLYYGTRNMFWFERKYANKVQFCAFIVYFVFVKLPFLIGLSIFYHRSIVSFKRCLEGIMHGFR